jgi:uncharacterized membrane protein YraQ (UPF0718 family)
MARTVRSDPVAVPTLDRPAWVRTWGPPIGLLAAALCAVVAVRVAPSATPWLGNFLVVFVSLLVQALPFVLMGAMASAAIEVFVPQSVFARLGRLPRALQQPTAGLFGMALPICECGSVPVARRLVLRGLSPAAAITFMLAAPVVNPIVIVSTAVAYRGRPEAAAIVVGRVVLAFVAALAAGWLVSGLRTGDLLRARPGADPSGHHPPTVAEAHSPRARAYILHLTADTMFMGRYLVIGGALAAALQTFVPAGVVDRMADTPVLDILVMMALAGVLSLCSESDAFVAVSFVAFRPGAQLAFLVFGPLFDAKLASLYAATFSRRFAAMVLVVVASVTLAGTLWLEVLM